MTLPFKQSVQFLENIYDILAAAVSGSAPINTTATLEVGDLEIGAVELKNGTDDTRGKVAATGSISEGDNAIAVHDPVLGATTGAALDADGTGTVQQYLRGLLKVFLARIPTDPAKESGKLTDISTVAGATNGAALDADGTGTLQQYLRGLLKVVFSWLTPVETTIIAAGDMSGNIASSTLTLGKQKFVSLQFHADSGTHVGTISVQTSNDGTNWATLVLSSIPAAAAGSAFDAEVVLWNVPSKYLKAVYTATSGSGTLVGSAITKG